MLIDLLTSKYKEAKEVLRWPEFRVFWILLPSLAAAYAVGAFFTPIFWGTILGGIFIVIAAEVFSAIYRSARKDRENVVERSELRNILHGLQDALIVYNRDFKVLFFNSAAENLFRAGAGDVLGRELRPQDVEKEKMRLLAQVVFPSLAPNVISRSVAGEYPQIVDLSFEDPALELRVTTVPVNDNKRNLIGFMKIIRDRTREITLIKSKSEFLTVASHQLRTPATDINWALQSLGKDASLSEESKAVLEQASSASRELLQVIEDLLNVAKIEEGRFGYEYAQADIVEFIGKVLARIAPIARKAGIHVYFDKPEEELPKFFIDADKLMIAFNNLLENAIRYNVENGEVTIKIEKVRNQPFVEVSVKDTGIGVPESELGKLFSKFFRADNALKAQTEGSGLGLYITKNIIRAHGGKIWAESEEGRGSIFHLTLPTDPELVPKREVGIEE